MSVNLETLGNLGVKLTLLKKAFILLIAELWKNSQEVLPQVSQPNQWHSKQASTLGNTEISGQGPDHSFLFKWKGWQPKYLN